MTTRRKDGAMQEAQRWHRTLLNHPTLSEREAFAAWLLRSADHYRAFWRHLHIDSRLHGIDPGDKLDLEAIIARALRTNVVPLQGHRVYHETAEGAVTNAPQCAPTSDSRSPRGRRRLAAIAAGLVVLGCALWGVTSHLRRGGSMEYDTRTGEQLRVPLPDGTVVELNTQSRLQVDYSPRHRDVTLLAGEALFSVHHDARRPFSVHVNKTIIDVLGTEFSVYKRPDSTTTVAVLEGKVQVSYDVPGVSDPKSPFPIGNAPNSAAPEPVLSPTPVSAGQSVRIVANGQLVQHEKLGESHPTAWTEHQLWFEGSSLAEIAAEFNRYNERKILVTLGAVTAVKRYTGNFDAYDPDSFLQFVRQDPSLYADITDRRVVIASR